MNEVQAVLDFVLKENGFKKKGSNTYLRPNGEVLSGVHVTKSRWNGQHFLEAGLIHPQVELSAASDSGSWHINRRLETVAPDREELLQALNSDNDMAASVRAAFIKKTIDFVDLVLFSKIRTCGEMEDFAMLLPAERKPWLVPFPMIKYVLEKRGLPVPTYD